MKTNVLSSQHIVYHGGLSAAVNAMANSPWVILEAARTDAAPALRALAARADRDAGRDLAWARADAVAFVRRIAALADLDNGRDLAWARNDAAAGVREIAAS